MRLLCEWGIREINCPVTSARLAMLNKIRNALMLSSYPSHIKLLQPSCYMTISSSAYMGCWKPYSRAYA